MKADTEIVDLFEIAFFIIGIIAICYGAYISQTSPFESVKLVSIGFLTIITMIIMVRFNKIEVMLWQLKK